MAIGDGTQATPSSIGAALRETLVEKFAEVEQRDGPRNPPPEPAATPVPEAEATAPAGETAEQKAGRTAGRPRDAQGRLLPGKPAKDAEPQAQKPAASSPPPAAAQPAPAAPAPDAVEAPKAPAIPRPTSWKKDYHEAFDKLAAENPSLAAYINQREIEQSRGIAQHAERYAAVKPLIDVVTPYLPEMQKHGIDPTQMVGNLLNAHKTLALGDPQTKIGLFQKLLVDYGIQAQLAAQGPDGQWQLLAAQAYQPPQQQQPPAQNIEQTVQEILQRERMQQQIQEFTGNTEKHPHYEEVRDTMAGLLQAGLADDLESAYEAALHHPRHRNLLAAQQTAQREQEEATRRAAEQQRVASARAKAVSTPSATPGGPATATGKSLRESLAEKVYAAQGGGRV